MDHLSTFISLSIEEIKKITATEFATYLEDDELREIMLNVGGISCWKFEQFIALQPGNVSLDDDDWTLFSSAFKFLDKSDIEKITGSWMDKFLSVPLLESMILDIDENENSWSSNQFSGLNAAALNQLLESQWKTIGSSKGGAAGVLGLSIKAIRGLEVSTFFQMLSSDKKVCEVIFNIGAPQCWTLDQFIAACDVMTKVRPKVGVGNNWGIVVDKLGVDVFNRFSIVAIETLTKDILHDMLGIDDIKNVILNVGGNSCWTLQQFSALSGNSLNALSLVDWSMITSSVSGLQAIINLDSTKIKCLEVDTIKEMLRNYKLKDIILNVGVGASWKIEQFCSLSAEALSCLSEEDWAVVAKTSGGRQAFSILPADTIEKLNADTVKKILTSFALANKMLKVGEENCWTLEQFNMLGADALNIFSKSNWETIGLSKKGPQAVSKFTEDKISDLNQDTLLNMLCSSKVTAAVMFNINNNYCWNSKQFEAARKELSKFGGHRYDFSGNKWEDVAKARGVSFFLSLSVDVIALFSKDILQDMLDVDLIRDVILKVGETNSWRPNQFSALTADALSGLSSDQWKIVAKSTGGAKAVLDLDPDKIKGLGTDALCAIICASDAIAKIIFNVDSDGSWNGNQFSAALIAFSSFGGYYKNKWNEIVKALGASIFNELSVAAIQMLSKNIFHDLLDNDLIAAVLLNIGDEGEYWSLDQFGALNADAVNEISKNQWEIIAKSTSGRQAVCDLTTKKIAKLNADTLRNILCSSNSMAEVIFNVGAEKCWNEDNFRAALNELSSFGGYYINLGNSNKSKKIADKWQEVVDSLGPSVFNKFSTTAISILSKDILRDLLSVKSINDVILNVGKNDCWTYEQFNALSGDALNSLSLPGWNTVINNVEGFRAIINFDVAKIKDLDAFTIKYLLDFSLVNDVILNVGNLNSWGGDQFNALSADALHLLSEDDWFKVAGSVDGLNAIKNFDKNKIGQLEADTIEKMCKVPAIADIILNVGNDNSWSLEKFNQICIDAVMNWNFEVWGKIAKAKDGLHAIGKLSEERITRIAESPKYNIFANSQLYELLKAGACNTEILNVIFNVGAADCWNEKQFLCVNGLANIGKGEWTYLDFDYSMYCLLSPKAIEQISVDGLKNMMSQQKARDVILLMGLSDANKVTQTWTKEQFKAIAPDALNAFTADYWGIIAKNKYARVAICEYDAEYIKKLIATTIILWCALPELKNIIFNVGSVGSWQSKQFSSLNADVLNSFYSVSGEKSVALTNYWLDLARSKGGAEAVRCLDIDTIKGLNVGALTGILAAKDLILDSEITNLADVVLYIGRDDCWNSDQFYALNSQALEAYTQDDWLILAAQPDVFLKMPESFINKISSSTLEAVLHSDAASDIILDVGKVNSWTVKQFSSLSGEALGALRRDQWLRIVASPGGLCAISQFSAETIAGISSDTFEIMSSIPDIADIIFNVGGDGAWNQSKFCGLTAYCLGDIEVTNWAKLANSPKGLDALNNLSTNTIKYLSNATRARMYSISKIQSMMLNIGEKDSWGMREWLLTDASALNGLNKWQLSIVAKSKDGLNFLSQFNDLSWAKLSLSTVQNLMGASLQLCQQLLSSGLSASQLLSLPVSIINWFSSVHWAYIGANPAAKSFIAKLQNLNLPVATLIRMYANTDLAPMMLNNAELSAKLISYGLFTGVENFIDPVTKSVKRRVIGKDELLNYTVDQIKGKTLQDIESLMLNADNVELICSVGSPGCWRKDQFEALSIPCYEGITEKGWTYVAKTQEGRNALFNMQNRTAEGLLNSKTLRRMCASDDLLKIVCGSDAVGVSWGYYYFKWSVVKDAIPAQGWTYIAKLTNTLTDTSTGKEFKFLSPDFYLASFTATDMATITNEVFRNMQDSELMLQHMVKMWCADSCVSVGSSDTFSNKIDGKVKFKYIPMSMWDVTNNSFWIEVGKSASTLIHDLTSDEIRNLSPDLLSKILSSPVLEKIICDVGEIGGWTIDQFSAIPWTSWRVFSPHSWIRIANSKYGLNTVLPNLTGHEAALGKDTWRSMLCSSIIAKKFLSVSDANINTIVLSYVKQFTPSDWQLICNLSDGVVINNISISIIKKYFDAELCENLLSRKNCYITVCSVGNVGCWEINQFKAIPKASWKSIPSAGWILAGKNDLVQAYIRSLTDSEISDLDAVTFKNMLTSTDLLKIICSPGKENCWTMRQFSAIPMSNWRFIPPAGWIYVFNTIGFDFLDDLDFSKIDVVALNNMKCRYFVTVKNNDSNNRYMSEADFLKLTGEALGAYITKDWRNIALHAESEDGVRALLNLKEETIKQLNLDTVEKMFAVNEIRKIIINVGKRNDKDQKEAWSKGQFLSLSGKTLAALNATDWQTVASSTDGVNAILNMREETIKDLDFATVKKMLGVEDIKNIIINVGKVDVNGEKAGWSKAQFLALNGSAMNALDEGVYWQAIAKSPDGLAAVSELPVDTIQQFKGSTVQAMLSDNSIRIIVLYARSIAYNGSLQLWRSEQFGALTGQALSAISSDQLDESLKWSNAFRDLSEAVLGELNSSMMNNLIVNQYFDFNSYNSGSKFKILAEKLNLITPQSWEQSSYEGNHMFIFSRMPEWMIKELSRTTIGNMLKNSTRYRDVICNVGGALSWNASQFCGMQGDAFNAFDYQCWAIVRNSQAGLTAFRNLKVEQIQAFEGRTVLYLIKLFSSTIFGSADTCWNEEQFKAFVSALSSVLITDRDQLSNGYLDTEELNANSQLASGYFNTDDFLRIKENKLILLDQRAVRLISTLDPEIFSVGHSGALSDAQFYALSGYGMRGLTADTWSNAIDADVRVNLIPETSYLDFDDATVKTMLSSSSALFKMMTSIGGEYCLTNSQFKALLSSYAGYSDYDKSNPAVKAWVKIGNTQDGRGVINDLTLEEIKTVAEQPGALRGLLSSESLVNIVCNVGNTNSWSRPQFEAIPVTSWHEIPPEAWQVVGASDKGKLVIRDLLETNKLTEESFKNIMSSSDLVNIICDIGGVNGWLISQFKSNRMGNWKYITKGWDTVGKSAAGRNLVNDLTVSEIEKLDKVTQVNMLKSTDLAKVMLNVGSIGSWTVDQFKALDQAALIDYISHSDTIALQSTFSINAIRLFSKETVAAYRQIWGFNLPPSHFRAFSGRGLESYTQEELQAYAGIPYSLNPDRVSDNDLLEMDLQTLKSLTAESYRMLQNLTFGFVNNGTDKFDQLVRWELYKEIPIKALLGAERERIVEIEDRTRFDYYGYADDVSTNFARRIMNITTQEVSQLMPKEFEKIWLTPKLAGKTIFIGQEGDIFGSSWNIDGRLWMVDKISALSEACFNVMADSSQVVFWHARTWLAENRNKSKFSGHFLFKIFKGGNNNEILTYKDAQNSFTARNLAAGADHDFLEKAWDEAKEAMAKNHSWVRLLAESDFGSADKSYSKLLSSFNNVSITSNSAEAAVNLLESFDSVDGKYFISYFSNDEIKNFNISILESLSLTVLCQKDASNVFILDSVWLALEQQCKNSPNFESIKRKFLDKIPKELQSNIVSTPIVSGASIPSLGELRLHRAADSDALTSESAIDRMLNRLNLPTQDAVIDTSQFQDFIDLAEEFNGELPEDPNDPIKQSKVNKSALQYANNIVAFGFRLNQYYAWQRQYEADKSLAWFIASGDEQGYSKSSAYKAYVSGTKDAGQTDPTNTQVNILNATSIINIQTQLRKIKGSFSTNDLAVTVVTDVAAIATVFHASFTAARFDNYYKFKTNWSGVARTNPKQFNFVNQSFSASLFLSSLFSAASAAVSAGVKNATTPSGDITWGLSVAGQSITAASNMVKAFGGLWRAISHDEVRWSKPSESHQLPKSLAVGELLASVGNVFSLLSSMMAMLDGGATEGEIVAFSEGLVSTVAGFGTAAIYQLASDKLKGQVAKDLITVYSKMSPEERANFKLVFDKTLGSGNELNQNALDNILVRDVDESDESYKTRNNDFQEKLRKTLIEHAKSSGIPLDDSVPLKNIIPKLREVSTAQKYKKFADGMGVVTGILASIDINTWRSMTALRDMSTQLKEIKETKIKAGYTAVIEEGLEKYYWDLSDGLIANASISLILGVAAAAMIPFPPLALLAVVVAGAAAVIQGGMSQVAINDQRNKLGKFYNDRGGLQKVYDDFMYQANDKNVISILTANQAMISQELQTVIIGSQAMSKNAVQAGLIATSGSLANEADSLLNENTITHRNILNLAMPGGGFTTSKLDLFSEMVPDGEGRYGLIDLGSMAFESKVLIQFYSPIMTPESSVEIDENKYRKNFRKIISSNFRGCIFDLSNPQFTKANSISMDLNGLLVSYWGSSLVVSNAFTNLNMLEYVVKLGGAATYIFSSLANTRFTNGNATDSKNGQTTIDYDQLDATGYVASIKMDAGKNNLTVNKNLINTEDAYYWQQSGAGVDSEAAGFNGKQSSKTDYLIIDKVTNQELTGLSDTIDENSNVNMIVCLEGDGNILTGYNGMTLAGGGSATYFFNPYSDSSKIKREFNNLNNLDDFDGLDAIGIRQGTKLAVNSSGQVMSEIFNVNTVSVEALLSIKSVYFHLDKNYRDLSIINTESLQKYVIYDFMNNAKYNDIYLSVGVEGYKFSGQDLRNYMEYAFDEVAMMVSGVGVRADNSQLYSTNVTSKSYGTTVTKGEQGVALNEVNTLDKYHVYDYSFCTAPVILNYESTEGANVNSVSIAKLDENGKVKTVDTIGGLNQVVGTNFSDSYINISDTLRVSDSGGANLFEVSNGAKLEISGFQSNKVDGTAPLMSALVKLTVDYLSSIRFGYDDYSNLYLTCERTGLERSSFDVKIDQYLNDIDGACNYSNVLAFQVFENSSKTTGYFMVNNINQLINDMALIHTYSMTDTSSSQVAPVIDIKKYVQW